MEAETYTNSCFRCLLCCDATSREFPVFDDKGALSVGNSSCFGLHFAHTRQTKTIPHIKTPKSNHSSSNPAGRSSLLRTTVDGRLRTTPHDARDAGRTMRTLRVFVRRTPLRAFAMKTQRTPRGQTWMMSSSCACCVCLSGMICPSSSSFSSSCVAPCRCLNRSNLLTDRGRKVEEVTHHSYIRSPGVSTRQNVLLVKLNWSVWGKSGLVKRS